MSKKRRFRRIAGTRSRPSRQGRIYDAQETEERESRAVSPASLASAIAHAPSAGAQASLLNRVASGSSSANQSLLQLQRQYGNHHVQQVVALASSGKRNQVAPQGHLLIQGKLAVGQPGDRYEQEADLVSAEVVNQMNAPQSVQRQPSADEEEETVRTKPVAQQVGSLGVSSASGNGAMTVPSQLEADIQGARGGGHPLPDQVREPIEQTFGADFSGVKVHTDAEADRLNRSIQAKAFTTGQDIFFRQGSYEPGSQQGQELLAHELTHVVQQNGSRAECEPVSIQRYPNVQTGEMLLEEAGSPPGVHDARTAVYYARARRMLRVYESHTNRQLIEEAQRLDTFLMGRCADFGPEAQSEIAQLLIAMEGEMSRRLRQADIGANNLPNLEGITWNPDDPLAGTTEAIAPFSMLDVWTTFVRRQPEAPLSVTEIEMEEERVIGEIPVTEVEMEEERVIGEHPPLPEGIVPRPPEEDWAQSQAFWSFLQGMFLDLPLGGIVGAVVSSVQMLGALIEFREEYLHYAYRRGWWHAAFWTPPHRRAPRAGAFMSGEAETHPEEVIERYNLGYNDGQSCRPGIYANCWQAILDRQHEQTDEHRRFIEYLNRPENQRRREEEISHCLRDRYPFNSREFNSLIYRAIERS